MNATLPQPSILYIHLGDREWGNELMRKAAQEAFDSHPDVPDLVVHVHEHAGWFLEFLRDGTIVGTANDRAAMSDACRAFWEKTRGATWNHLGTILRP